MWSDSNLKQYSCLEILDQQGNPNLTPLVVISPYQTRRRNEIQTKQNQNEAKHWECGKCIKISHHFKRHTTPLSKLFTNGE